MDDFAAFARACLDADEAFIVQARDRHGDVGVPFDHDQLLAGIAADRAVLDQLEAAAAKCPPDDWPDSGDMTAAPMADFARHLVLLLAQKFAGRPGWQDEWTVTP